MHIREQDTRRRQLMCRRLVRCGLFAAIAVLAAGCAGSKPPASPGSTDTSGYMTSGTRSSIVVTNTRYERAIECGGAIARLHKEEAGAVDADEVEALGAAWMANAIELGARRGFTETQVIAATGKAGGGMSATDAASVWTGCKAGT